MRHFAHIAFSIFIAPFLVQTTYADLPSIERKVSSFSFDYDRDGIVTPDELLRLKTDSASIQVQFFEDEDSVEFIKQFDLTEGSMYSWYGTVLNRFDCNLNIIIGNDDRITGSVTIGNKIYSIVTLPDGSVTVQEFDVSSFPREEEPESRNERMLQLSSSSNQMRLLTERDLQSTDDDGSVIDIICVYTPQAVCSFTNGGKCNPTDTKLKKIMEDKCQLSVMEANVAYRESGVTTSLNLVYTGLVDTDYKEESDMCATLNLIRSSNDKAYKNIRALRETYKADLVTMLVSSLQYCGCGDIFNGNPDAAYSLVSHYCATGYYSVAHEVRHIDCRHNLFSICLAHVITKTKYMICIFRLVIIWDAITIDRMNRILQDQDFHLDIWILKPTFEPSCPTIVPQNHARESRDFQRACHPPSTMVRYLEAEIMTTPNR